mgnify:CR=1 FL=1
MQSKSPLGYREISSCRICGNDDLEEVLDLGNQALTGVFPETPTESIITGPLRLVKCVETNNSGFCGLVQLKHSYDPKELYGNNYGYRSGLNPSMVRHLHQKVDQIVEKYPLNPEDVILDIGSNDGTLLGFYPLNNLTLIGIDPTGEKFQEYYPEHITLIPDFFSASRVLEIVEGRKPKVITSIAMFYDLEDPLAFMREISEILADDGVWILEQSYMPRMIDETEYDTVCHEHLEYYGLRQIKWMADRVGLKIAEVKFNDINGGSFSVTLSKNGSRHEKADSVIQKTLEYETVKGLGSLAPYHKFSNQVLSHKKELCELLCKIRDAGENIIGYGASTKGNVILQYCGITAGLIPYIAEVNEYKFGRYTPGTSIPIISENEAHSLKPDYFLVLPWHFRNFIVEKERKFLELGGRLIFPLPSIEIVSG